MQTQLIIFVEVVAGERGFYDDNDQRVAELTTKLYQAARQLDDSN